MATPSGRRGTPRLLIPLAGGLLLGGITAGVGWWVLSGFAETLPVAGRVAVIAAVAAATVADEVLGMGWRWPQSARQVPQAVRRRSPRAALLQFGFELGTGVRTYLTSRAPYTLVVLLVFGGLSLLQAILLGLGFGAGRALMPVTRTLANDPRRWDDRLARTDRVGKVTATVLTAVTATAVAAATLSS